MTEVDITNLGLGRLPAADERDQMFHMKLAIPTEAPTRTYRYWNANGWWGDQQTTPQCVGYSWAHWVEDGPITHKGSAPIIAPEVIYREAQKIDEWPGEGYEGTSVRAGAKVLQALGFIESYYWAWDAKTVADTILTRGPVVVGTNWYRDMFFPDPETYIVKPTGAAVGGHAYLINGVNVKKGLFRFKNSWGNGKDSINNWGDNGHAWITIEDMDKLIKQDGEACLAVEIKK
ncbi:MAG TPA: hypothetical protein VGD26_04520 [Chitinophagaceae bacterium]